MDVSRPFRPVPLPQTCDELAALGANVVRVFCFLPDFLPAPDVVNEKARDRLAPSSSLPPARACGRSPPSWLATCLAKIGRPSGATEGTGTRIPFSSMRASCWSASVRLALCSGDARIAAWLLTNEWPLFAGTIGSEQSERWAQRLIEVLRAADPECNVSDRRWCLGCHRGGARRSTHGRAARTRGFCRPALLSKRN